MKKFTTGFLSLLFISGSLFVFNQLINTSNAEFEAAQPIHVAKNTATVSQPSPTQSEGSTEEPVETVEQIAKQQPDYGLWAEILAMFVDEEG